MRACCQHLLFLFYMVTIYYFTIHLVYSCLTGEFMLQTDFVGVVYRKNYMFIVGTPCVYHTHLSPGTRLLFSVQRRAPVCLNSNVDPVLESECPYFLQESNGDAVEFNLAENVDMEIIFSSGVEETLKKERIIKMYS